LEIALPPALIPSVLSREIPPTVTLLVVIPVDPIVVLPPIVATSNVTFLAVAILNVLPVWVIAILSPSLKATVSPPLTSSAAVEQGAPSQTNPPSSNQTGQGQTASSKKKGLPKTGQNTSGWAVLGLTLLMFAFTLKKRSRN